MRHRPPAVRGRGRRRKPRSTISAVKNLREAGRYSLHMDDPFGYDVQISGLEANALSDG